jgi:hypothetical protein
LVVGGNRGALGLHGLWKAFVVACFAASFIFPASALAQQDISGQTSRIAFNIPAQSLGRALAAFGEATGFEVIADGRQAYGRISSPVAGEMSPAEALRTLIVGTGLTVRAYAPGNARLVLAPAPIAEPDFSPATSPHASYFAAVQEMILQTICRADVGLLDGHRLAIMLWLAPSGAVTRVQLLDTIGERQRDAVLSAAFERSEVGTPLPVGLKQPITLVVRPQPSPGGRDCGGTRPELRRASN